MPRVFLASDKEVVSMLLFRVLLLRLWFICLHMQVVNLLTLLLLHEVIEDAPLGLLRFCSSHRRTQTFFFPEFRLLLILDVIELIFVDIHERLLTVGEPIGAIDIFFLGRILYLDTIRARDAHSGLNLYLYGILIDLG